MKPTNKQRRSNVEIDGGDSESRNSYPCSGVSSFMSSVIKTRVAQINIYKSNGHESKSNFFGSDRISNITMRYRGKCNDHQRCNRLFSGMTNK